MRNSYPVYNSAGTALESGLTLDVYEYDSGQPNNRGTLLGTMTEVSTTGVYYLDLTTGATCVVVNRSTGLNLTAGEKVKFFGDTISAEEVNFIEDTW